MEIFVTISFHKLSTSCSKNAYRCSPSRQVQGLKMDQTKGFRYYWNHVLSYVENSTLIWAKRNLESLRCKSLVPENYLKNISKGDLVEETLMYNSQTYIKIWIFPPRTESQAFVLVFVSKKTKFLTAKHWLSWLPVTQKLRRTVL